MLGVALAGRGRLDEANDRYQRALRNDPEDATAHRISSVGGRRGDQSLSSDPYDRSEVHPLHNNLGITPRDADRLNEAISHYEKALRMEPGLSRVDAALGQALLGLGRFAI